MLRKNFLFLVIVLASFFAVAMQATVWQKTPSIAEADITSTQTFQEYWADGKNHEDRYWLIDSLGRDTSKTVLSFAKKYYRLDTQAKAQATEPNTQAVLSAVRLISQKNFEVITPIDTKLFPHSVGMYQNGMPKLLAKNRSYKIYHEYLHVLDREWLEDELWGRIRLSPTQLPTGHFKCIPSLLLNQKPTIEEAEGQSDSLDISQDKYLLKFKNRSIEIHYNRVFPHEISGWIERNGGNTVVAIRHN